MARPTREQVRRMARKLAMLVSRPHRMRQGLIEEEVAMPERATMDLPELGKVLGIARGTVYELASRQALPIQVLRLGRRLVVSRAEVEELLNGRNPVRDSNDRA